MHYIKNRAKAWIGMALVPVSGTGLHIVTLLQLY
jgi:hypothetical protein